MLNAIWSGFFLVAAGTAAWRLGMGDAHVLAAVMQAIFTSAKAAFEIALGLTGVMTFWLGILRVGERAGVLEGLTRLLKPLFARLFPEVPAGHPALGAMTMNLAANMLGLDNAATPAGLQAMRELQTLNTRGDEASNAQILFLVLNSACLTLFPVSILVFRAQLGAHDPADVYVPILISTMSAFLVGLVVTAIVQRIRLADGVVLAFAGSLLILTAVLALWFMRLPEVQMLQQSSILANGLLLLMMALFVLLAWWRRVNVYDAFIDGAREGFSTAVSIIPALTAMLVAIGVLRACGALDLLQDGVRTLTSAIGADGRWVDALPTALMKPLSGSGARAMMIDTMRQFGADSLPGRMACVIQGSTETTFYVIAVYFGAAGIRRTRHAVPCALVADLAGLVTAMVVSLHFFG